MKRLLMLTAAAVIAVCSAAPSATALAPYEAYTYNYYEDSVPLPAPYLPERSITGNDLGIGAFKDPNDIYVTNDGFIYVLDSGNSRIIALDSEWNVLRIIEGFKLNGADERFANPGGIFVTDEDKTIYVADTDKKRIVVLTAEGELIDIVDNPQSDILPASFQFVPTKVTVDTAGRLFVVARGVFEGLMQFDEAGNFIGYVGTINVAQSFADKVWRRIATRAQREQMQLYIPTEFTNVDIDPKGFIYSTNLDLNTKKPIKRLNPSGEDVIKRFGYYPNVGDVRYRIFGNNSGPSKLIDIKLLGGGMYMVLDSLRGRLFAYNDEGELLYAFGGRGTQLGVFNTPVAVERVGNRLLVLDRGKNNIVVYEPTAFGAAVHEATTLHYNGDNEQAVEIWKEVIRMTTNYDIAYVGIGKSLLIEKENKEAMSYFKLGMQRKYYSVAFKRHRREVMQEHFSAFMSTAIGLIVLLFSLKLVKKWRIRRTGRHETGLH